MSELKWFSLELENTDPDTDAVRKFCKENRIYYEASACENMTHFEIKCSPAMAERIETEVLGL